MVNPYVVVVAVLAIILAVMALNARLSHRPGANTGSRDENEEMETNLLCKFVHHDGNVVGETVAIHGDQLILKQEGVFKSVPRNQIQEDGDDLLLSGFIQWDAAIQEGNAWHQTNTTGADPAVTTDLTRSEDVKAPALEAFKRRERRGGNDEEE